MATIKDIAKLSGVSHGTVSNVLNKRGNVSAEKIRLVEDAANQLGFHLSAQAKQLRQGHNKLVCVVLPNLSKQLYVDLFTSLNALLRDQGYDVSLDLTSDLEYREIEIIAKAQAKNPDYIVVVSSFLTNPGIYTSSTKFIFVERYMEGAPENSSFIEFDYFSAANQILQYIIEAKSFRSIAYFTSDSKYSNNANFYVTLQNGLAQQGIHIDLFSEDDELAHNAAFEILMEDDPYDLVITSNIERANLLLSVAKFNTREKLPKIVSFYRDSNEENEQITYFYFNTRLLGEKISDLIKNQTEDDTSIKRITPAGFKMDFKSSIQHPESEIVLLTLTSPSCNALRKMSENFYHKTNIRLKIVDMPYDELLTTVNSSEEGKGFDMIRMDMALLKEIGTKVYTELDENEIPIQSILSRIDERIPAEYYRCDEKMISLPFDPSVQILHYRKDFFNDVKIQREFFEMNGNKLAVPNTFEEFRKVSRFFTRKFNPTSPTIYGTSLVYGSAVVATCDFLPRLYELKGTIFEHGKVNINSADMTKALNNYCDTVEYTDKKVNIWWQAGTENFTKGLAAMNIVFSNHSSNLITNPETKVIGRVGNAIVPGGSPLLGGGVIGITKQTSKISECIEFLNWFYSAKIAVMFTYLGGFSPVRSIQDDLRLKDVYPWIENIYESFKIGTRRHDDLELPAFTERRFEQILGVSIRNAVTGITSVSESLVNSQALIEKEINTVI